MNEKYAGKAEKLMPGAKEKPAISKTDLEADRFAIDEDTFQGEGIADLIGSVFTRQPHIAPTRDRTGENPGALEF